MKFRHTRQILRASVVPLLLAAGAGGACAGVAGASLGAVLGPLAFVPLLIPPLVVTLERRVDQAVVALVVSVGLMVGPFVALHALSMALLEWQCVLLALSCALAGTVRLLLRMHVAPVFASALVTFFALAWLGWPVWLAPHVSALGGERLVSWLVPAHPIFATNALFLKLGIWTEMSRAYRLTNLNQDVAYALPAGPWACVGMHGLVGLLLMTKRAKNTSLQRPPAGGCAPPREV